MLPAVATLAAAIGHGMMVIPPPRNTIDNNIPPWSTATTPNRVPGGGLGNGLCYAPATAPNATVSASQACFWFSAGCAIGCKTCDGFSRGPIPNIPCDSNPSKDSNCAHKVPVCKDGLRLPLLPKQARTVNIDAEDGAANDYYQFSPWRAPGSSGIPDPCGVAGGMDGRPSPQHNFDIDFVNTTHAKSGMRGSSLPWRDMGTVWRAGDVVEVSWTFNANHGGGYYYRLCKLPTDGSPVTEACFQETPLRFVGKTRFRWNGDRSTEEEIDNVFVAEGTHPPGSQWAMNPVPRNDSGQTGKSFAPKCNETCHGCDSLDSPNCLNCRCTGSWGYGNVEIVDNVALPWMLPPGDYVVGWRWDAEEANQVWGNCADVRITAHPDYNSFLTANDHDRATTVHAVVGSDVRCPLPPAQCFGGAGNLDIFENSSHQVAHVPLNETLAYVRSLMQQAIEVEHSTIPLYLSAMWSIVNNSADVTQTIHSVVIEEMLHMTIAANVLNAIGGAPMIDSPTFIPVFPLALPLTNVSVGISPLSKTTLQNFMLIEATTHDDRSIGAAYSYVLSLLQALCEEYGEDAIFTGDPSLQVMASTFGQPAQTANKVTGLADAISALLGVAEQGGGCPVTGKEWLWPRVSNISSTNGPLGGLYSHWARFASAHAGRAWTSTDTVDTGPTGVQLPPFGSVRQFTPNPSISNYARGTHAYALVQGFASNYTALLVQLHNVFNGAPQTYFSTLSAMHALTSNALELLATPDPRKGVERGSVLGTPWEYVPTSSQFMARNGKARPIL